MAFARDATLGSWRAFVLIVAGAALLRAAGQTQEPVSPARDAAIPVGVVVLDRNGRLVDDLARDSFSVTVEGEPRRVLWVRYVSRGPGATDEATRRSPTRAEGHAFAAEPARSIVVVIDETSFPRGGERDIVQAASVLIDRLGLDDRIAVVRLPIARDQTFTLTTDRPEVRAALRQVVGRADLDGLSAPPAEVTLPPVADDPGRAVEGRDATSEAQRPPLEIERAVRPDDVALTTPGGLPGLAGLVEALRSSGGRKIIALFSAGLPSVPPSQLDALAADAARAHAVIYAFAARRRSLEGDDRAGFAVLEQLATATGGSFTVLGRDTDKAVGRALAEWAACYVLGVEGVPSDADGRRRTLRVATTGRASTLRAPAWLVVPTAAVADWMPPATIPSPTPAPERAGPATPTGRATPPRAEGAGTKPADRARDSELQRLLTRAVDYVEEYKREHSLLVAEEEYYQSTRGRAQVVRSDLLLVHQERSGEWVSFRDVFEVNGRPVRDRDDRLKRLFLDPRMEAQAQLDAIMSESARYNIGQVYRNMNVPLFALTILESSNLPRFKFKLAGTQDVDHVSTSRVSFEEEARPTLVYQNEVGDAPARGWFLIDPASGAVVRTRLEFDLVNPASRIDFEVRYRRDDVLGLWVPREMREVYAVYTPHSREFRVTVDARATYSNFRRFQVKTEEQIQIPKF